jgi:hypothetical protein
MAEIDGIELEGFLDHVGEVVEGLKDGTITKNPLHIDMEEVDETVVATTAAQGSATEMGESEMTTPEETVETPPEDGEPADMTINGTNFSFTPEGECIGKASAVFVVVSSAEGEVVFGNAAIAAREVGLNPTTARERCKKEYVCKDGLTWTYRSND